LHSWQESDLSELLSFDPSSIGAASPEVEAEGPQSTEIIGRLNRIKELLSTPIEALVQTSDEVKQILDEVEAQVPEALLIQLWSAGHLSFFRKRVELARRRIETRRAQAPLKADIASRCQALNQKKSALDAKADTSTADQKLESLKKELAYHEARVRETKQSIQEHEDSMAASKREVDELQSQLKAELEELRSLNRQIVAGEDKEDEAVIAEADRVRADAIRAIDDFLSSV
jgi:chromosome segregation ATPase